MSSWAWREETMADTKSKVLIIGGTGYIGSHLVKASIRLGHPTFILVRSITFTDPAKVERLNAFLKLRVRDLKDNINDHVSLVAAFRQVDVVISAVNGPALHAQVKILDAAKEAGTIKRFRPSEFGNDVDRLETDFNPVERVYRVKRNLRREIENSGVPYTFVIPGGLAGHFVFNLGQDNVRAPPCDNSPARVLQYWQGLLDNDSLLP